LRSCQQSRNRPGARLQRRGQGNPSGACKATVRPCQAGVVTTFSTSSRPALRAAACGGRPRPAAPCRQNPASRTADLGACQPEAAPRLWLGCSCVTAGRPARCSRSTVACWSRWGRWCWPVRSILLARLIARRCGGMCCCGTCGFWSGVCCWAWRPGTTVANPAIGERDEPASDQGFAQNFWLPA
jgi:hypothetical protein